MSFYDTTVRHAIYIERYKRRVAREILERIDALTGDLFLQVSASELESMTRRDLDRLLAQINRVVTDGYAPITEQIDNALREFAVYEAGWQAENLVRSGLVADIGVPSDADLWSAMYSRPFQGKLLRDWLRDLPANTSARVRQAIRQGYADGESALEIARRIRGTRSRQGVMDISRRGAEAMTRTAVAHTADRARARTYRQNPAIIGVQEVSVLDHRTSSQCRFLDGKIWEIGSANEKRFTPPGHIGCRRTRTPVTNSNRAGLRTRPTYNDWLKEQPASVQDDVLGPTRGQLFRDGGLSVDRFTDASGQEYTLDQLRQRDAEAFNEAFGE